MNNRPSIKITQYTIQRYLVESDNASLPQRVRFTGAQGIFIKRSPRGNNRKPVRNRDLQLRNLFFAEISDF